MAEKSPEQIEYESDPTACLFPYPEHDYETEYEDEEVWQGLCRRCGAEALEDK